MKQHSFFVHGTNIACTHSTTGRIWSGENRYQGVLEIAAHTVPHFQNDAGHPVITIGVKRFMCVGANAPFDHPHEFLDMGNDSEIICPYCSTLYRYSADLEATETNPGGCIYVLQVS